MTRNDRPGEEAKISVGLFRLYLLTVFIYAVVASHEEFVGMILDRIIGFFYGK